MKWQRARLDSVADLCLGKMLDQNKNRGELMPYLANVNVRWGEFELSDLRTMRFEAHEMDRYGLKTGDIVMCEGGEPGRCAIWNDQMPGMMIQKALHRIRPHSGLDHRFLYYSLLQKGKTGEFGHLFTGATIKHLPGQNLAKLEVDIPPRAQQSRIASILSAYDEAIENNRRRMALLEKAARLLYEEWFVRLHFPGHEHTPVKDGVPQGWSSQKLEELAAVNRASLPASYNGEIQYVDISAVMPGQITETTAFEFRDAPSRARRVVKHGDILWSCARPNRRSHAVVWNPPANLIVSTGFAVITPTAAPTSFLYYATTTDAFVGYLEKHAKGAAYPAVVAKDFERAMLLAPPTKLLRAFDDIVYPMLSQVHKLQSDNQKLRTARDLLLPRLMSGKIEV